MSARTYAKSCTKAKPSPAKEFVDRVDAITLKLERVVDRAELLLEILRLCNEDESHISPERLSSLTPALSEMASTISDDVDDARNSITEFWERIQPMFAERAAEKGRA